MAETEIVVAGLEELVKRLDDIAGPRMGRRVMGFALMKGATTMRDRIRPLAPRRRKGRIRRGLRVIRKGPGVLAISATGQTFGGIHEFGSRKLRKRPFLRPGFDSSKQEVIDIVSETIEEIIK